MDEHFDVAILGGGPAGLAAAAYTLHAQLRVALVSPDLGGKVSYPFVLRGAPAVDTVWGAGFVHELEQLVSRELQHHIQDSAGRVEAAHDGTFRIGLNSGDAIEAKAVVVATGARPQRLFVAGEMEYWGRGLSFSAVSHAPLFGGRSVAVVGGGDRAIRAVRLLTPFVEHLFYVAARPQHISDPAVADRVLAHPKVSVFQGWEVQQISGDDFVTGIDLVGVNGEVRALAVEGVFVQFGLLPNNSAIRDLVALDEQGHVIVDAQANTSVPGIFAAGDVTNAYAEQVPVSIGDGAKAGISAWHYVAG
jgi:thioredoxin reductase